MNSNGGAGGRAEVRGCQEAGEEAEEDDDSRGEAGEDQREASVTDIAISPVISRESGDHKKLETGFRKKLNFNLNFIRVKY